MKIHPEKNLTSQRSNIQPKGSIDDIKVEDLPKSEKAKYLGQTITFEQQETTDRKSRIRAAWHHFQIQARVDVEIISSTASDFSRSIWSSLPR